jgi:hypothetical protein
MTPFVRLPPPLWEGEPCDEELGWADDDSVPINIYGETEEETD